MKVVCTSSSAEPRTKGQGGCGELDADRGSLGYKPNDREEEMKPAQTSKHETVVKELRHERLTEEQRLYKLQMKVVEKLGKVQAMRAA